MWIYVYFSFVETVNSFMFSLFSVVYPEYGVGLTLSVKTLRQWGTLVRGFNMKF